ncbi:MAG: TIGR00725 family protein [Desulfococcaceae bacterium]
MKRPIVVGVMGGGSVPPETMEIAERLGRRIAEAGWVLLNGGRNAGVMAASAKGAAEAGGLTIGVLPDDHDHAAAPGIRIPILTGIGGGRNMVNILSSQVVIACRGGAGTLSEIALALKHRRPVILLDFAVGDFFRPFAAEGQLHEAATPEGAVALAGEVLGVGAKK